MPVELPETLDVPYVGIGRLIDAPEPEPEKKPELRVYDPKKVTLSFNGIEIKGFVDSPIEVVHEITKPVGIPKAELVGSITIRLLQIGAISPEEAREWVFDTDDFVRRFWKKTRRRARMARKKRRGWA